MNNWRRGLVYDPNHYLFRLQDDIVLWKNRIFIDNDNRQLLRLQVVVPSVFDI